MTEAKCEECSFVEMGYTHSSAGLETVALVCKDCGNKEIKQIRQQSLFDFCASHSNLPIKVMSR